MENSGNYIVPVSTTFFRNFSYHSATTTVTLVVIQKHAHHIAEYNMEISVGIYNDLAMDLDLRIRTKQGKHTSNILATLHLLWSVA